MERLKVTFNSLFIIGAFGLGIMFLLMPKSETENYFVFQIILLAAIVPRVFLEMIMLPGNINYSKSPQGLIGVKLLLFYCAYCAAFEYVFSPGLSLWFVAIIIPVVAVFWMFAYNFIKPEKREGEKL